MFFYLSKVLWNFFNPINMLVILLFIGIIFHLLKKKNFYRKIYQITFILFILIAFLPTGTYLLWKLENTFPKPKIITNNVDGILILGSGINESMTYEHQQIILNDRIERMTESIKLMKKFPKAKIILSGGNGTLSKPKLKGSDAAKMFYKLMGIEIDRIIFEDKSKNTYENFVFSKKFINNKNDETWLLVTSAFHMKRAMSVAKKLNLNFIPYPVDYMVGKNFEWKSWYHKTNFLHNMNDFQLATHEYIGLIAYYLTKKSNSMY